MENKSGISEGDADGGDSPGYEESVLKTGAGQILLNESPYREPSRLKTIDESTSSSYTTTSSGTTLSSTSGSLTTSSTSYSLASSEDDTTGTSLSSTASRSISSSLTSSSISVSQLQSSPRSLRRELIASNSSGSIATTPPTTPTSNKSDSDEYSIMIRVKLPESHPLITKVLRLPLNATIKECVSKIHQIVNLVNHRDCVISHNHSVLPANSLLIHHFGSSDESIVHTIEVKEVPRKPVKESSTGNLFSLATSTLSSLSNSNNNNNNSSPNSPSSTSSTTSNNSSNPGTPGSGTKPTRPSLLHSNSVQSLLTKKRGNTYGQKDNQMIFQAPPPSYTKDLENLIWVQSPNHPQKNIPCLYHKWKSRDSAESNLTILYSAGNFEDIGITKKLMRILSETLQCNIFSYDYTGFGLNSSGQATIKELYEDLFIVFGHLMSTLKIPPKNIILMGKSIGTITTMKFASTLFPKPQAKKSIASLKTPQSPIEQCKVYKSVGGIILLNSFGPVGLSENLVNMVLSQFDAFDHLRKIDRIQCPVLLVHGEDDQVVSHKSSKKLAKIFQSHLYKFVQVKEAGHFNIDTQFLDDYEDHLIDFVKYISPESFQRKERELPVQYSMSPSKVIGNWLERLGLGQYSQNFLEYGYFDLTSISTLDSSMLEMMGIQDESHLTLLLEAIDKLSETFIKEMYSQSPINNNNSESKRNSSNSTSSHHSSSSTSSSNIYNNHVKQNSVKSLDFTGMSSLGSISVGGILHSNSSVSVSSSSSSESVSQSCCTCLPESDCTCSSTANSEPIALNTSTSTTTRKPASITSQ